MSVPQNRRQQFAFALGVATQALGWALVFAGFALVWARQTKVTPFRYMGF